MTETTAATQELAQMRHAAVVLRQAVVALTAFLTVVDLFAAQALLPSLAARYGVMPSAIGLAVNACTLGMAIGGLAVAFLGDRIERRRGILVSLCLLSIPTLLLAVAPNLWVFAVLRIAQGLCMSAAFGLTLAYLGERYDGTEAAGLFAAYITGNVASNLVGRMIATTVVDHAGLAANFAVFAALNIAGAVLVYSTVEHVPRIRDDNENARSPMQSWSAHLANPALRPGFAIGFCILFAFIGTFTYVNFVLVNPPFGVGMMQLGLVYLVFLPSIFTTPLAGSFRLRVGTRTSLLVGFGVAVAGLPLLLSSILAAVLGGMVLVAVGTFFAQAIATGYVSRVARQNRSAASGIYLASYFTGGLVGSAVLGQLFDHIGWSACVAGIGAALISAAVSTRRLTEPDRLELKPHEYMP